MKEYKRCKYCSMEMDKLAIKCPHCKKVQASKFSFSGKSENLIVLLLIIVAIIVGFSSKFSNIQSSISSITSSFKVPELPGELGDMVEFFTEDDEYIYDDESYIEVYIEDFVSEFEEDCENAYDYYDGSTIEIVGNIAYIDSDNKGRYIYLDTGVSYYSICICISIEDTDDVDYVDSLDIGDAIRYQGEFYMESPYDYEIYLTNWYII